MAKTKSICRSDRRSLFSYTSTKKFLLIRLLVISLAGTCSEAQDIITNTVTPPKETTLEKLSNPIAVESTTASATRIVSPTKTTKPRATAITVSRKYVCPSSNPAGLALIFSLPCKRHVECSFLGDQQLCCKGYCRKGLPVLPKEPKHQAVFGVNRMCPKKPVPEVLPVTRCQTDSDCEGETRICCPDKDYNLYCRTPAPVWSELPFPRTHAPLMSLLGYMQCEVPPPRLLDLLPRTCNRTVDCFPNLCCQEGSNKFCRPPKKSLIALVAQTTQRFARG